MRAGSREQTWRPYFARWSGDGELNAGQAAAKSCIAAPHRRLPRRAAPQHKLLRELTKPSLQSHCVRKRGCRRGGLYVAANIHCCSAAPEHPSRGAICASAAARERPGPVPTEIRHTLSTMRPGPTLIIAVASRSDRPSVLGAADPHVSRALRHGCMGRWFCPPPATPERAPCVAMPLRVVAEVQRGRLCR